MNFKQIVLIIGLILPFSCKDTNSKKAGKPVLNFDKQIINVGDIKSGIPYGGKIIIRNTGNAELKIGDLTTDCACTVADIEKKNILPDDSIFISYKVNPHTMGFFQQKIIIQNNTDKNPVMFVIRGKTI